MNNHEYYEILVSRNKDHDLDKNEKLELEKHLDICESCKMFNSKINKMSLLLNREENPVILVAKEENKKHIFHFNQKYVFSIAASLLVFVGAVIFLSNRNNSNVKDDITTVVKIETSDYSINQNDYNSKPLSIFLDYGDNETNNYSSKPMESYWVYSF